MSSKENMLTLLNTLCQYSDVSIKHEFKEEDLTLMTVKCLRNSKTIEITYHCTKHVELFNNFESAIESIQTVIRDYRLKTVAKTRSVIVP